jgi:hypothetical protein
MPPLEGQQEQEDCEGVLRLQRLQRPENLHRRHRLMKRSKHHHFNHLVIACLELINFFSIPLFILCIALCETNVLYLYCLDFLCSVF